MSEKSPKRGILSSLMGLFGEDAQAEAEQERDKAAQDAGKGFDAPVSESAGGGASDEQTNGTVTAPGSGSVVRESYEPGWYAVSTARTSRPTFVSEPWGGTTLPPVEAGATVERTQDSAPAPAGTVADDRPTDVESWRPETPVGEPPVEEPASQGPAPIYTQPYSHQPVQVPDEPASEEPPAPEQAWQEPQPEQPWQERQPEQSWQEPQPEQSWEIPPPAAPVQSWQESQPEQSWEIPAPAPAEPRQSWEQPNQVVEPEQSWEAPQPAQSWEDLQGPAQESWSEPETSPEVEVGSVSAQPEAQPTWSEPQPSEAWSEPESEQPWSEPEVPQPAPVAEEQAPPVEHASVEFVADEPVAPEADATTAVGEPVYGESPSLPTETSETVAGNDLQDLDVAAAEVADIDVPLTAGSWAAESEPQVVYEVPPEPESAAERAAEPDVPVEPEPEAVVEVAVEPEPEPELEAVVEVAVEPEPEPEPEPVAEAAVEPQEEPVAEVPVEPEPEPEPQVAVEVAEPEAQLVAEPEEYGLAVELEALAPTAEAEHDWIGESLADTDQDTAAGAADDPDEDDVEDEMPAQEQELATVPAAPAPEENAGLQSRVAAERRSALDELVARGVTDDDVQTVAGLLQDPERGIRVAAVEALVASADAVDAAAVRQALRDPSDEVRAGAVRLAAARAAQDVPEVFPMVAERQWPGTQQAALDTMPRAVRLFGISEDDLDETLRAVGTMDSEPNSTERAGFATLAVAIGTERLASALDGIGDSRLGAARLLLQEGSLESLRALAPFARDPEQEVARLGRAAFDRLGPEEEAPAEADEEPEQAMDIIEEQTVESFEAELGPQGEMVSGLARALGDPDEAVRDRAADALRSMDRGTLIGWALAAMGSNDQSQVELGAQVAEAANLTETAGELLARGAAEAAEARGPFSRALASFSLSPEQLVQLVNDMDSQHKAEGVRMLWHIGGRSLLPAVQPLLDDSSAAVRVAALEVFGESADAQTIEVAQRVLERDSSPVVRATAISVIGRAGLDQRAASLAQALADPDPDVRATAVEVLPAGMGRQAAELLLEALGDDDERVWQAAIRHLASVPDRDRSIVWQAIERCPANRREHLVATLERSSAERLALLALDHLPSQDAAERTLAITLAGRAGTPECVRGIVQSLQDPAPTVRRTAASALLTLRSGESIAGLSRALSDPDVEVRVEAVRALSVIDDDNVLDPLITALKDPETRVRDVAGEALVRWRSPAVARRLAIALTNPSLRRPAGEVLARMGNSAVDPLVDILMEDDSELAGTVGHLLESLVGPDVFLTRLGSMDASDRLRAVEALGAIRGDRGVDGLVRALSDPVESIRVRAVTLLGEIGDERAFEAVKQAFLSDPVLEVVTAAEEALKRLQGGQNPAAPR